MIVIGKQCNAVALAYDKDYSITKKWIEIILQQKLVTVDNGASLDTEGKKTIGEFFVMNKSETDKKGLFNTWTCITVLWVQN